MSLDLSDTQVTFYCLPDSGKDEYVPIKTSAVDAENDALTYIYTVSGGRIKGQGAEVEWDSSGTASRTYSITAAVDDGNGVSTRTVTKSVAVVRIPVRRK